MKTFNLKAKELITSPEGKKQYNKEHFTESAPRYDFATKALSIFQDSIWKNKLIKKLPNSPNPKCLDLACGTGDITFMLSSKFPNGEIIGLDLTKAMLDVAEDRKNSDSNNTYKNIEFIEGDIAKLDFEDASIDIITGGYALRNSPKLEETIEEIYRVLKPGGVAAFLDFVKPDSPFLQKLQYLILKLWGGMWGLILHGNPEVHGYISQSLKNYPTKSKLAKLIKNCDLKIKDRSCLGMVEIIVIKK